MRESSSLLHLDNKSQALEKEHEAQHRTWIGSVKGILGALLVVFCHVVSITSVQLLQKRIPDIELNAFRCFVILIYCVTQMLFKKKLPTVLSSERPVMLLYAVFVTLDSASFFIGVAVMPAAFAQSVENSAYLIFVLVLFWFFGLEKLRFAKHFSVILCAIGVILVLQPWHKSNANKISEAFVSEGQEINHTHFMEALCHHSEPLNKTSFLCGLEIDNETMSKCETVQSDIVESNVSYKSPFPCEKFSSCWLQTHGHTQRNTGDTGHTEVWLHCVTSPQKNMIILGTFFTGFAGLSLASLSLLFQKYPCLSEDRCRSLFWSFTFSLIVSLFLMLLVEKPMWPESVFDGVVVSMHCFASLFTWTFTLYSLQHISGSTFSVIYSTAVVFLLIPQYTILSSILPGNKNWIEVVGVVVVLIGSCLASSQEIQQNT